MATITFFPLAGSDGIATVSAFATAELDLMVTHNPGVTLIPAMPGFMFVPISGRLGITKWVATGNMVTSPNIRVGNDTNVCNVIGNGQNAINTPSAAVINASATQRAGGGAVSTATPPFWSVLGGIQSGGLVDLATPVRLDVTAVDNTNLTTFKGRYWIFGQLFPSSFFA